MITSFETLEHAKTIVFTSSLLTLAAAACDQLEIAGQPAILRQAKGQFVVTVPTEFARSSMMLLEARPHNGEIFF